MERNTVQRRAVQRALNEAGRPIGPAEIHAIARSEAPGLGIATVYRCIKRLLEDGVIVAVDLPGEAPRYELAGKGHHHHFRCDGCQKVFDLVGCCERIEALTPKGFRLANHELYLFGTCRECTAGA